MSSTPSKLTLLLPTTPYILAYTLPLLLLSVLLTFAGTFLTIDRSRSFTPRSDASNYSSLPGAFDNPKKKRRFSWLLEGGIGGLASGYAFGRMSFLSHQYLQVYIDNLRIFKSISLPSLFFSYLRHLPPLRYLPNHSLLSGSYPVSSPPSLPDDTGTPLCY